MKERRFGELDVLAPLQRLAERRSVCAARHAVEIDRCVPLGVEVLGPTGLLVLLLVVVELHVITVRVDLSLAICLRVFHLGVFGRCVTFLRVFLSTLQACLLPPSFLFIVMQVEANDDAIACCNLDIHVDMIHWRLVGHECAQLDAARALHVVTPRCAHPAHPPALALAVLARARARRLVLVRVPVHDDNLGLHHHLVVRSRCNATYWSAASVKSIGAHTKCLS